MFRPIGDLKRRRKGAQVEKATQVRHTALTLALDYHARVMNAPTPEEITATAEKFLGFLLVQKGAQQPRAKRA